MRDLVTGSTGFLGRHLVSRLLALGDEVHGASRGPATPGAASHAACDLLDPRATEEAVARVRPDRIFHLAGFASARLAMERPAECWDLNVRGTVHLLEAARRRCAGATVVLVGSAMQYGVVQDPDQPIRESEPLQPREPYGASKAAAEIAGLQWGACHGLRVVLLRAFNTTGPGQGPDFVCSDFARQIARLERGLQEPVIATGDLKIARDLMDARDAAEALCLAAEGCRPGRPYNVCTGEAVAIGQVLDTLRTMTTSPFAIEIDPAKVRKVDIPALRGDPTEFRQATGWRPRIPLQETLRELLDGWRASIGGAAVERP